MNEHDRYADLDYRKLITWSTRLEREWPLLTEHLASAPEKSVVDLGCGPGEHLRRFAREGWKTFGIDLSAAQIESARQSLPDGDFAVGDLGAVATVTDAHFGAAICLGNVLSSLDDATFAAMLEGLAERLLPGAPIVFHQLEATPILAGRRRAIGPFFRSGPDADDPTTETVFFRAFAPSPRPGHVFFFPVRLLLSTSGEPVTLAGAERIEQRLRTHDEVVASLESHGFTIDRLCGDPEGTPHDPESAHDLWILAHRRTDGRNP